ncbi:MAG TPA: ABC transporter permease [Candidatus Eisenbacteria bacterium]|jgi:putative ABC transport system permease protein
MNARESAGIALQSLRANKLRSVLTLLGVIIGVSSVIAVMSLVQGLNRFVAGQLMSAGSNVFTVDKVGLGLDWNTVRDRLKRRDLVPEDAAAIARTGRHVAAAGAERHAPARLRAGGRTLAGVDVRGVEPDYLQLTDLTIARGRAIGAADVVGREGVCVIGSEVAERLFTPLDPLGRDLRVADRRLGVVGIGERRGTASGNPQDVYVLVPLPVFERMFGRLGSATLRVRSLSQSDFEQAQDEARAILRLRRHLRPEAPDDFEIVTPSLVLGLWHTISGAIFLVTFGVSAISLLVGGITIMNIMLVSVTERTREIGVRKAMGARARDILGQFLIEAITLSASGGAVGLVLGAAFALVLGLVTPLPTYVSPFAVAAGLLTSTLVGVVFGIWPAARAARLNPVDALRYE